MDIKRWNLIPEIPVPEKAFARDISGFSARVILFHPGEKLVTVLRSAIVYTSYMSRKGILLVGHGSKLPFNKELVEETAALIARDYPDFVVKCGFMNMNSPSIEDSLNEFRKEPIDVLVIVPLFLAKGVHILKDIPGILGLPEGEKQGQFALNGKTIPLLYADPIGSDPLLADLMVKNAERELSLYNPL